MEDFILLLKLLHAFNHILFQKLGGSDLDFFDVCVLIGHPRSARIMLALLILSLFPPKLCLLAKQLAVSPDCKFFPGGARTDVPLLPHLVSSSSAPCAFFIPPV